MLYCRVKLYTNELRDKKKWNEQLDKKKKKLNRINPGKMALTIKLL